jgi:AraC-like DNA-binding protein
MINGIADSLNQYLVVIIHGSLILMAFLFSFNALKVNRVANIYFGIFLFIWSTFWIEEIFSLVMLSSISGIYEFALRFVQFLVPIFFYLATVHYTQPKFTFKTKHLGLIIAPIVYFIAMMVCGVNPDDSYCKTFYTVAILLHALIHIYMSYNEIQKHKLRLIQYSSVIEERDLKWLERIIITVLMLLIFIGIYNAIFSVTYLSLVANLFSFVIVFIVAFDGIRQKEVFIINQKQWSSILESTEKVPAEKRKPLAPEEFEKLKNDLLLLMETKQPFLQPDLSLPQLAKMVNLTSHQLSFLINEGFDENFFSFINKYRIEKIKNKLIKSDLKQLSIIGIAYECGFNSKTAFYNTFKKVTSMTPSEFIKKSTYL